MLTYYLSGSNGYSIRTSKLTNTNLTMVLQDMTQLTNSTASLSNLNYNSYESLLAFTASIGKTITGQEYRAELYQSGSSDPVWHGSLQVFRPQDVDKANYTNQNNQYTSNVSENKYVILE